MTYKYTDEELADQIKHITTHVLGPDIYKRLRAMLSEEKLEQLNKTFSNLTECDQHRKSTEMFPKTITDWYYNRNNHYYHELNDEAFLAYIQNRFK